MIIIYLDKWDILYLMPTLIRIKIFIWVLLMFINDLVTKPDYKLLFRAIQMVI